MRRRPTFGRTGAVAVLACAGAVACSGGEPRARHHRVEIRDAAFHPRTLDAAPGDSITWINLDVVPHTASAGEGGWDSGPLGPGESYTLVVQEGRTGGYACLYHPAMTATLGMP